MKKEDFINLLQVTGVDGNAFTLAVNAYEIGHEEAKHEALRQSFMFNKKEDDGKNSTEI